MLILSRLKDEKIQIGDNIYITVLAIRGNRVRLGIHAPENVIIKRSELDNKGPREGGRQLGLADSRQSVDTKPAA